MKRRQTDTRLAAWVGLAFLGCSQPAKDGGSDGMASERVSDAGEADAEDGFWTPPAACRPERAIYDSTLCPGSAAVVWNGAGCEELPCGCAGPDCAAASRLPSRCRMTYAACHPPSTCDDAWYRCPEVCPSRLVLQGGGRSPGACSGDCEFELTLAASAILDASACDVSGTLRVHNTDGSERFTNFALSADAQQEMTLISLALQGASIDAVAGCPDCSDGGAAWIVRSLDGLTGPQDKFSYALDAPPPALRAANAFVQRLIDAALDCSGTDTDFWTCGISHERRTPKCDATVSEISCDTLPSGLLSTIGGLPCDGRCGVHPISGGSKCTLECMTFCEVSPPEQLWAPSCGD